MFCATRSRTSAGKRDHFLLTAASANTFAAAFGGNSDSVLQGTSTKRGIVEHKQALQLLLGGHRNLAEPAEQPRRWQVAAVNPVNDLVEAAVGFCDCHAWAFAI